MASTEFLLEAAMKSLNELGFVDLRDLTVGEHVTEMEQKRFAFLSPYGLEYCHQYVLSDPHVRSIIESVFSRCKLGHWLRYQALPGHIECFSRGGLKAGRRVLVVQQWAKGSQVTYYSGSHQCDLPTKTGVRSLHETSKTELNAAGCEAIEMNFPEGGLVIRDARLYVESKAGYAITFMFAPDEVLAPWPKITLPNLPELVQKADNMGDFKIGLNFEFKDVASSERNAV